MEIRFLHRGNDVLDEIKAAGFDIKVAFDVGAHKGESILWIKSKFCNSNVHAFEPIAEHLEAISSNLLASSLMNVNCKVIVNPIAMGRSEGVLNIVLAGSGTHIQKESEPVGNRDVRTISVGTIYTYCQNNNIIDIDFLKIDVEGFEIDVLIGANKILFDGSVKFIYLEVGMSEENKHHTFFLDVYGYLNLCGYRFFGVYEQINEFLIDKPNLRRANFCFIHRRYC